MATTVKSQLLARWHQLVDGRHTHGLEDLLAEDVVFFSPVVHAAQTGKQITARYLKAAFAVLVNESFEYVRQIAGENEAALEFQVEIDGVVVNGVDLVKWNAEGKIVEFKVMLRPLKAINLIHQKMAAMLAAAAVASENLE